MGPLLKYMGSKTWQLRNGLGHKLRRVAKPDDTFVDLFAGSGSVAWFAAEQLGLRVKAFDLQMYAVVLSAAVIEREHAIDVGRISREWLRPVLDGLAAAPAVAESRKLLARSLTKPAVERTRKIAAGADGVFARSYGGYYYSLEQAWCLDALRSSLPRRAPVRTLCLAALITAASRCSASPGHTAQPLRPTPNGLPHVESIWRRSFVEEVHRALDEIAPRHAHRRGASARADAEQRATRLAGGELVFLDPPYSAAQYSRYYHVLEAVAVGGYEQVSGEGRSPALSLRTSSAFSRVSDSKSSLHRLLSTLARKNCRVVATFPQYKASNGLSGDEIAELARSWFEVDVQASSSRFSTLGGNGSIRAARQRSQELIITMYPRS